MSRMRVLLARLRALLSRGRLERELDEEIRFHLEMLTEDNVRSGMDPVEARDAARRSFGAVQPMKERYRDARGLPFFETLARDLRYAIHLMRKNPGFTFIAALSLAIGIGANGAVFSLADGLLLRPVPVPRASELVTIGFPDPPGGRDSLSASYLDFLDLREQSESFAGLVAFTTGTAAFTFRPDLPPEPVIGMIVSGDFFRVLGVEPSLGRDFRSEEDEVPGRDAVVILGHEFWEQRLGADASVVGRTVRLNGIDFAVVGVAPFGFTGLDPFTRFEFYVPLMMWSRFLPDPDRRPLAARDFRSLTIKGRLAPGATLTLARAELAVLDRDLERAYPATNRDRRLAIRTELQERIAERPSLALLIVMLVTLAAALLLVACANVAGLLASRAPMREREIALRLAIGASRPRVLRQLMTESLLVAGLGGLLGLAVGYGGVTLFRRFRIPTDLPIAASFDLDARALTVSLVIALVSALLFGIVPAIRATGGDLTALPKPSDATARPRRRRWPRASLVGGQVAVSVVLLVVATFLYRGFRERLAEGPGFRTDGILMMWFDPSLSQYSGAESERFFERLVEDVRLLPAVRSATLTSSVPLDGFVGRVAVVPEDASLPVELENVRVSSAVVDEAYFDTLDIPLLEGRSFAATDGAEAPLVAIVNERFAERFWPGLDPLGKRFRLEDREGPWVSVVGVARNGKYASLGEPPREFVYFPFRQQPRSLMALLVESSGEPSALVAAIRSVVHGLDPGQPIYNLRALDENYRLRQLVIVDVVLRLVGAMGICALALALAGLHGLVAQDVTRRSKEIGIRMAMGAGRRDAVLLVLKDALAPAGFGLLAGVLSSVGAAQLLKAFFPAGVAHGDALDPAAFAVVVVAVLLVTVLAAYLPARRASHHHPTEALRYE